VCVTHLWQEAAAAAAAGVLSEGAVMALVPFHVSGAAASQDLEERLMQVGGGRLVRISVLLRMRKGSPCHYHGSGPLVSCGFWEAAGGDLIV
jgi:hypothetical protein